MLHVYHLLLLTPSSTPNLQASAGTELLLKPLSVANKPQLGSTCLDWSHILYTEKKAFSFNELFNLVYGFIFNFIATFTRSLYILMFSRSKTTYRERVWTERRTVTVHDELKDFNTRRRLLFRFFCTLIPNLTTKTLFNVTVFSPFIYFCTFICNCWRCLSIRWSIKAFICPMSELWNHINNYFSPLNIIGFWLVFR